MPVVAKGRVSLTLLSGSGAVISAAGAAMNRRHFLHERITEDTDFLGLNTQAP